MEASKQIFLTAVNLWNGVNGEKPAQAYPQELRDSVDWQTAQLGSNSTMALEIGLAAGGSVLAVFCLVMLGGYIAEKCFCEAPAEVEEPLTHNDVLHSRGLYVGDYNSTQTSDGAEFKLDNRPVDRTSSFSDQRQDTTPQIIITSALSPTAEGVHKVPSTHASRPDPIDAQEIEGINSEEIARLLDTASESDLVALRNEQAANQSKEANELFLSGENT